MLPACWTKLSILNVVGSVMAEAVTDAKRVIFDRV